jgi:hypothetical protein
MSGPRSTHDLLPSERHFVIAMSELRFGRFEFLKIEGGELVLDPWPTTRRDVKFGSPDAAMHKPLREEFERKGQVTEFFDYVRAVDSGQIRCLELRHGVLFTMEIEQGPNGSGGGRG